jgi:hypothetical protein
MKLLPEPYFPPAYTIVISGFKSRLNKQTYSGFLGVILLIHLFLIALA